MTAYRLYFLSANDHIEDVRILDCGSDQEALESAREFIDGRDLELWERDRFISRLPRVGAPWLAPGSCHWQPQRSEPVAPLLDPPVHPR